MDFYILDEDGEPMKLEGSMHEIMLIYSRWRTTHDPHVFDDTINDIRISTVFLGMDHGWGTGPPVLFETMIFGGEYDEYQRRYYNKIQAKAGHDQALAMVRDSLSNPNLEFKEYENETE